mmetsp:Transcript_84702/g.182577  ORF Transcript_84702/g.182577 Transcript_84702/m.182577 type:complete len:106 (-) Transcript_84702:43-360(-)
MCSIDGLLRDFEKKVSAILRDPSSKRAALESLLGEQQVCQSKIVHSPYRGTDDRYEDMANDYAEFLHEHYVKTIRRCRQELAKLPKPEAKEGGEQADLPSAGAIQ